MIDQQLRLAVDFKDVKEIRFGQRTEKFKRNNRPDLEAFSFSLIMKGDDPNDTLDLVCKDEKEFQTWTKVLQTLTDVCCLLFVFNVIVAGD